MSRYHNRLVEVIRMKKGTILAGVILLLLPLFAFEQQSEEVFGVNAETKQQRESVKVITNGEEKEEGVVHWVKDIAGSEHYEYAVALKGKGTVFLRIQETDGRGKYIKETEGETVFLDDSWKVHSLSLKTQAETSQVDLFVLTDSPQKAHFSIKALTFERGG